MNTISLTLTYDQASLLHGMLYNRVTSLGVALGRLSPLKVKRALELRARIEALHPLSVELRNYLVLFGEEVSQP